MSLCQQYFVPLSEWHKQRYMNIQVAIFPFSSQISGYEKLLKIIHSSHHACSSAVRSNQQDRSTLLSSFWSSIKLLKTAFLRWKHFY